MRNIKNNFKYNTIFWQNIAFGFGACNWSWYTIKIIIINQIKSRHWNNILKLQYVFQTGIETFMEPKFNKN